MKIKALTKARDFAVQARAKVSIPASTTKDGLPLVLDKAAADATATIYIYGPIGIDWWTGEGCTAASMVKAIADAKAGGATSLDVRILSEGGDCFDGVGIYEALKRCGMKTTAYNDGLCASAATMVALGCDKVVAAPTSMWMMHRAWSIAGGHESDMLAMGELLRNLDTTIAAVYSEKSGKSVKECLALMTEEKGGPDGNWMTAEECKEAGFADEIAREDSDGADAEDDADKEAENSVMRLVAQTSRRVANQARIAAAADRAKTISGASPASSKPSGQPGGAKK